MKQIYNLPEAIIIKLFANDIMSLSLSVFDESFEDTISIGDVFK